MQSAPMPKVGVLLITTSRFHDLGQHTERGAFYTRKDQEASDIISQISTFSMPVFDNLKSQKIIVRTYESSSKISNICR